MKPISIPPEFGVLEDARFGYDGRPTIVFVGDRHISRRSQANIAKTYLHLETEYGLEIVGVEGNSKVFYLEFGDSEGPSLPKEDLYEMIDEMSQRPDFFYPSLMLGCPLAGVRVRLFGYEDVHLQKYHANLVLLARMLNSDNPRVRENGLMAVPLMVPEKYRNDPKAYLVRETARVGYDRTEVGIKNILDADESEDPRMLVMGRAHVYDFRKAQRKLQSDDILFNSCIIFPHGLDDTNEEMVPEYDRKLIEEVLGMEPSR